MPSNVEIKLRVDDLATVESKAAELANYGPELLVQTDTFFDVPTGRLKLRRFDDGKSELIAYQRSDSDTVRESKWSRYSIDSAESAEQLIETLAMVAPPTVIVHKQRTLYLIGQTRVHLDRVDQLGDFVELEVVLDNQQTTEQGTAIADNLINSLGLESSERIAAAYADLLLNEGAETEGN
jgi:predicted adenylyl cyclase CyaB